MARTINEIQQTMMDGIVAERPDLSSSAAAEWRLWTRVVATAIYLFEVVLDRFRTEVDETADKIAPGTVRWYIEQCRRFQDGHELLFDEKTAQLYYAEDDPEARIIDVVAVTEGADALSIKVATLDDQNRIVPLSADQLRNFAGYIDAIKFAGVEVTVVSTTADAVRYDMEVFYDPTVPATTVRERVVNALDAFRTGADFNATLYRQRFIAAVMAAEGVVTVDLKKLERKGASAEAFQTVAVADELEAGYFDYTDDSTLSFTSAGSL